MIFSCVLFKANSQVPDYSHCYDKTWVEKLYRGVKRHIQSPFRFVCFVDQDYDFNEPIESIRLEDPHHDWQSLMELFRLEGTVLAMGLDTVVTGDLTEIMSYRGALALTKDKYLSGIVCNGVMLFNDGPAIYKRFRQDPERRYAKLGAHPSELAWLRQNYKGRNQPDYVDDLFPGQILHYNWHIPKGDYDESNVRIVYFAGRTKPHTMLSVGTPHPPEFIVNAWR